MAARRFRRHEGSLAQGPHGKGTDRRRLVLVSLMAVAVATPALAAQTDITISTAPAPATPQINGARVLGSFPASPFLYTVSATGQAPLKFEAKGLPTGLSIDAAFGTISGTTPAAGTYPIELTVSNGSGSATGILTLKAGSTLALTPPMGWNSYDSFTASVKESDVKAAADAMQTLLQPHGWNTIVIDYLWYDPEKTVDSNGRWLPSTSKYPSATGSTGFKTVATYVHSKGLSFGIHLMRGVPRTTVQKNSPIADSTFTANQAGNTGDTCSWDDHMYGVKDSDAGNAWYDSIYKQYAEWGVDFVKVDDMMNPYASGGTNPLHSSEVEQVHASIVKTGRSMVLSLSPGPTQTRDVAVLVANANMWRQVNDFWDTNGLSSMSNEFDAAYAWSQTSGITPGHWPDADMLPLGTIGTRACAFSHNQQVQVMTLWAMMPSPLIFGGMMTKLANDSWTLALLTNDEVLAVNQDELGNRAKRISQQSNTEVWARDLADGRKAVALFNRATQDASVSVTFSQLGLTGSPAVRDLWNKKDVTGMTSGITVNVPHESALMYAVGTASTPGTGGSSGAGGGGGTTGPGGASGSGGRTGAGGAGGTDGGVGGSTARNGGATGPGSGGAAGAGNGGTTGRGGAAGTTTGGSAGATSPGSGGAPSTGGRNGQGGATSGNGGSTAGTGGSVGHGGQAGADTGTATTQAGCSCTVGTHRGASAWLIAFFAVPLLIRRRPAQGQR
jgi:alpha-galactosidase